MDTSVSYTHLDVYKRQEEYLNTLVKANNESLNAETLQQIMDEYSMEWILKQKGV